MQFRPGDLVRVPSGRLYRISGRTEDGKFWLNPSGHAVRLGVPLPPAGLSLVSRVEFR